MQHVTHLFLYYQKYFFILLLYINYNLLSVLRQIVFYRNSIDRSVCVVRLLQSLHTLLALAISLW